MGKSTDPRNIREHDDNSDDHRSRPARDRDRVLYSGAFRRLAGVTQVAAPLDAHLFHSRLSHTLEVAQIGRRIAERLIDPKSKPPQGLKEHLDPDVVEAACLIHDLGHPPFGHIAEKKLNELVCKENDDGFEGNAQSFRIITRLTVHREDYPGLDLCRATLNASLKYPWPRDLDKPDTYRWHKFGTYADDEGSFNHARKGLPANQLTIEAEIMDYADDIAYSVHDIIDFYRAGLLPLGSLAHDKSEYQLFIKAWEDDEDDRIPDELKNNPEQFEKFRKLIDSFLVRGEYRGTDDNRAAIRKIATSKIREYDIGASVEKDGGRFTLKRTPRLDTEIRFLKRVFYHYLISNQRLTTLQHGQRRIIEYLFNVYLDSMSDQRRTNLIPDRFQYQFELLGSKNKKSNRRRLAADIVSSFTDAQALAMFRRMNGTEPGAISDIVTY